MRRLVASILLALSSPSWHCLSARAAVPPSENAATDTSGADTPTADSAPDTRPAIGPVVLAPALEETIVVTADRTSGPAERVTDSVTVISAATLRRTQAASLADALRDVAGISIVRSGSPGHGTSAFLRGANPDQLLVLVDGVKVGNGLFGGVDLAAISTTGIDRVEILRGPQSPLYGAGAMAGVINIITGGDDADGIGYGMAECGSLSTCRASFQGRGTGRLASDRPGSLRWSLSGGRDDSSGQFVNDEFRGTQLTGRVRLELDDRSVVTLHGFHDRAHIGIPFNGETPAPDRNSESSLSVAGTEYAFQAGPRHALDVHASVAVRTSRYSDPLDPWSQASDSLAHLWHLSAQDTATIGRHSLVLGLEHEMEVVTASDNHEKVVDDTVRTSSVYVQDKLELGALLLSLGGRWDRHGLWGNHLSPRVSAAYRIDRQWRLRVAAGSAFRSPSMGELAYPFYGNPDLRPETSRSFEAGFDVGLHDASLSFTAFASTYRDLITFDPATLVAGNIDRARTRGVEFTATARLSPRWSVNGALTLLSTRDEETDLPLFRRPSSLGSVTLAYDRDEWGLHGRAHAVSRRLETDFSTGVNRYNGGYFKLDAGGFYRLRPWLKLTARTENLLDREYAEALSFSAPGRSYYVGLQFGR
jgi:vitamin B12 transporter